MARNYFNRYVWLIDLIGRHGHISFEEIDREWRRSPINEDRSPLAERTFHNHRVAIENTFGIEIKCDRALGYYLANGDDLEGDGIRRWLLESLSLNNLLNESADIRDRILFEKVPSSQKWLPVIVNAIRDGKAVELTYQSFRKDAPSTFTVHPYCLKLFKQRWYMLAKSEEIDTPRIYALDERMQNAIPLDKPLELPDHFRADEFFSNYFGISVNGRTPVTVRLMVAADQVGYFRSLPLHETQQLIDSQPEYSIFQYYLVPTYDFRQEILSHGPNVEVLTPEELREEIMEDIAKMASRYRMPVCNEDGLPYIDEEDEWKYLQK